MNNYLFYSSIGLIIIYMLYQKGIIFANFESLKPSQSIDLIKNEKVTILDVRTPQEYAQGYIPNAVLATLDTLQSELKSLEKYKNNKILVYCATGSRSVSASRILEKNGFTPLNMSGGINAWQRAGGEIKK